MTTSYERLREECNKKLQERAPKKVEVHDCPDCTGDKWEDATDYDYCITCLRCGRQDGIAIKKVQPGDISIADVLRVLPIGTSISLPYSDALMILCDGLWFHFTLSLPLSAPENEAACEAVLNLLTNN